MDAQEFCDVINGLGYRPGWTFHAEPKPDDMNVGAANVIMTFAVDTVDTNRDCAKRGYDTPKHITDTVPVDSTVFHSSTDVAAYVLANLMELELHEAREFLRLSTEDYRAPFHPHREEGQEAFARYFG